MKNEMNGTENKMKNSEKFKVIGIRNNIARLQRVGCAYFAMADGAEYIGHVGDVVELLEKDFTPEGDLSGYQRMCDMYDAE